MGAPDTVHSLTAFWPTPAPVPAAPEVVPLNMVESFDEVGRQDPYTLHQAEIEGDVLKLVVGYSGGCEEHEFGLWATRAFNKSLPPQHPLKLAHDAHGDACEAYIREELTLTWSCSENSTLARSGSWCTSTSRKS